MDFSGQYLEYDDYKDLGGTLAETSFNLLEFEARQNVDKYTFGRLKNLTEQNQEVKLCIYKLIGTIDSYNSQEALNKGVASENTDGYSVTYTTPSVTLVQAKNNDLEGIVKKYLVDCQLENGTPYLYCGADK